MTTKRLIPIFEKKFGPFHFGIFFSAARTTMGLTQAQMARKLGMARGTICDIEKGRQLVSPALAAKVAKKAGLSVELAVQTCLQDQLNKHKIKLNVRVEAA
jgi:DNA-binding XRE family transcriptional regulator